jgi:hypothetical protein
LLLLDELWLAVDITWGIYYGWLRFRGSGIVQVSVQIAVQVGDTKREAEVRR